MPYDKMYGKEHTPFQKEFEIGKFYKGEYLREAITRNLISKENPEGLESVTIASLGLTVVKPRLEEALKLIIPDDPHKVEESPSEQWIHHSYIIRESGDSIGYKSDLLTSFKPTIGGYICMDMRMYDLGNFAQDEIGYLIHETLNLKINRKT